MADESDRLDRLEEALAHLTATVDELNDVLTRQWQGLDAMNLQIRRLEDRLVRLEDDRDHGPAGEDPPPPHY